MLRLSASFLQIKNFLEHHNYCVFVCMCVCVCVCVCVFICLLALGILACFLGLMGDACW